MSLRESTLDYLKKRRQNILNGSINTIPSPFRRFSRDFLGWEQSTYYLFTSFTKGGKSQLVSYLLFESLLYCYHNEQRTGVSMKILYFNIEEAKERVMTRLYSWLLMTKEKYRISPADLRCSSNEAFPEKVLELLEKEELVDIVNYFENHIIFSEETNPTGIYKFCKKYAEDNGTVYTKPSKYKDDLGNVHDTTAFDYYVPNNPKEYVFCLIDTMNLIDTERGFTKKQSIDKMSEYLAMHMRNRYYMSPIVIQQQNVDNESIENIKMNKTRPSISGLGDSKYTGRDCNIALGIFSPYKFNLEKYLADESGISYDIIKLKDHFRTLEVLINRDGEMGGIIGLFFDGATCTWSELPKPSHTSEMNEVYKYVKTLN